MFSNSTSQKSISICADLVSAGNSSESSTVGNLNLGLFKKRKLFPNQHDGSKGKQTNNTSTSDVAAPLKVPYYLLNIPYPKGVQFSKQMWNSLNSAIYFLHMKSKYKDIPVNILQAMHEGVADCLAEKPDLLKPALYKEIVRSFSVRLSELCERFLLQNKTTNNSKSRQEIGFLTSEIKEKFERDISTTTSCPVQKPTHDIPMSKNVSASDLDKSNSKTMEQNVGQNATSTPRPKVTCSIINNGPEETQKSSQGSTTSITDVDSRMLKAEPDEDMQSEIMGSIVTQEISAPISCSLENEQGSQLPTLSLHSEHPNNDKFRQIGGSNLSLRAALLLSKKANSFQKSSLTDKFYVSYINVSCKELINVMIPEQVETMLLQKNFEISYHQLQKLSLNNVFKSVFLNSVPKQKEVYTADKTGDLIQICKAIELCLVAHAFSKTNRYSKRIKKLLSCFDRDVANMEKDRGQTLLPMTSLHEVVKRAEEISKTPITKYSLTRD